MTPIALAVTAPTLVGETLLSRRGRWTRRAALLRNDQRLPNDLSEALLGRVPILELAPSIAGDDTHVAFGVESRPEFGEQPCPDVIVDRCRMREVPEELNTCR
jgi:hypothetical protein